MRARLPRSLARPALVLLLISLSACQTAQQKSEGLVAKRAGQLKHLSSWKPMWCQVDTELTEPTRARYHEMFPEAGFAGDSADLSYAWRSRESSCEVTALKPSPLAKSHQAFLETSLCLLMQVHFVNSPFDELELNAGGIEPSGELAHIKAGSQPELGMFLPHDTVRIETRTKSRGTFSANYEPIQGVMLPTQLEQKRAGTVFLIDEVDYQPTSEGGVRPVLKSFWISVGTNGQAQKHSKAIVRDCRPL